MEADQTPDELRERRDRLARIEQLCTDALRMLDGTPNGLASAAKELVKLKDIAQGQEPSNAMGRGLV
jgi:hypothetical protein